MKPLSIASDKLKDLSARKNLRAAGHCCLLFALFAACYVSLSRFPIPVLFVCCFLLIGVLQYHLFIVFHESIHFLLFSKRWVNEWTGNVLGGTIGFTVAYRGHHFAHHRELGGSADPDFRSYGQSPRPRQQILCDLLGCMTGLNAIVQALRNTWAAQEPGPHPLREGLTVVAVQSLLFVTFALARHPGWYIMCWLLPLITVAKTISFYRTLAEHSLSAEGTFARLTRLRTFRPAMWERLLMAPMNFNFHAEHHWFPGIPYYNLPRLAATLEVDPEFNRCVDRQHSYIGFLWNEVIVPGWKKVR